MFPCENFKALNYNQHDYYNENIVIKTKKNLVKKSQFLRIFGTDFPAKKVLLTAKK
jgi:hypothetical protein